MLDAVTLPDLDDEAGTPDSVVLRHRLFSLVPGTIFQLAPDGVPVMAMPLGDGRAMIPVRGLIDELGIDNASPDGRMLALLPQALTYVNWLGLNDKLPPEIVTGRASWQPEPEHVAIAVRRVHLGLLRWHGRQGAAPAHLIRAALAGEESDEIRHATRDAFEQAAAALRITSAHAVIAEAETLAHELAYIEALRDTLLAPVHTLGEQIGRLGGGGRLDLARADLRASVLRLMGRAKTQLSERFADADAVLDGDIIETIRDADLKADLLRTARDGLHRSRRGWTTMFDVWETDADEHGQWRRMEQTYRFLAPRYMAVEEWARQPDAATAAARGGRECVVW